MQEQGYRSTLALHIPQEQIPVGSAVGESSKSLSRDAASPQASTSGSSTSPAPAGSGSGYGPPLPTNPTPLQRLAQQHLTEDSDFEMLCAPLSNGSWRQRFERMCIASPGGGQGSTGSSAMFDSRGNIYADGGRHGGNGNEDSAEASARVREAELWRLSGCFKRGEVNATRSGTLISAHLKAHSTSRNRLMTELPAGPPCCTFFDPQTRQAN